MIKRRQTRTIGKASKPVAPVVVEEEEIEQEVETEVEFEEEIEQEEIEQEVETEVEKEEVVEKTTKTPAKKVVKAAAKPTTKTTKVVKAPAKTVTKSTAKATPAKTATKSTAKATQAETKKVVFGFESRRQQTEERVFEEGKRMTRQSFIKRAHAKLTELPNSPFTTLEQTATVFGLFEETFKEVVPFHPIRLFGLMFSHSSRSARLSKVPGAENRFTLITPHSAVTASCRVDQLRWELESDEECPNFNIDVIEEDGVKYAGHFVDGEFIADDESQAILDEYLESVG